MPKKFGLAQSPSTQTPKQAPTEAVDHHHGELESFIYVVSDKAKMRWGDNLEYVTYAEAGDFIFVPTAKAVAPLSPTKK